MAVNITTGSDVLFSQDQVQSLISYYGNIPTLLLALSMDELPVEAPVQMVDQWISRSIITYFRGGLPQEMMGFPGVVDRSMQGLLASAFGITDLNRAVEINRMLRAYHYRLNADHSGTITVQVSPFLGTLTIDLPVLGFNIVHADYHDPTVYRALGAGPADVSSSSTPLRIQPTTTNINLVVGAPTAPAAVTSAFGALVPPALQYRPASNGVEVIGMIFTKRNTIGDFSWMINRPEYRDDLFIFNDHQQSSDDYRDLWINGIPGSTSLGSACMAGGGNAVIRPYRCIPGRKDHPRSAGLPTGYSIASGGYRNLAEAEAGAQWSMQYITNLVSSGQYRRVFFSQGDDGMIGQKLFHIAPDVRRYFTDFLLNLSTIPLR